jgi:hypothetical protein
MPEIDLLDVGSSLNSKTARVIERKCDFCKQNKPQEYGSELWTENSGIIGTYLVSDFAAITQLNYAFLAIEPDRRSSVQFL